MTTILKFQKPGQRNLKAQPMSLKALADKVIARNSLRNPRATDKEKPLDPNQIEGYKPSNREWVLWGRCACGECRYHKKRKCPVITQYETDLKNSKIPPKPINIIELWSSRERR